MEKILHTLQLLLSRAYVKFLSLTRASHSVPIPEDEVTIPEPTVQKKETVYEYKRKSVRLHNKKSLVIVTVGLMVIFTLYLEVVTPPADFPIETLVTLEEGRPVSTLAQSLEDQHVVQSAWWLSLLMRISGTDSNVHAGDYLFKHPQNLFDVARIITTGAYGLEPVRVTIPEGINVYQMANIYEKKMLRFNKDVFLKHALPYEGYLFPDTYVFLPNTKEIELVRVMKKTFDKNIQELLPAINASGRSLEDIVIMASIVEREAYNQNDRKMIAGVLWHRLAIDMPLQVDATFVYTHSKGSSQITMAELRDKSNAYNTYVHKGLPPGPIAAPGMGSLRATVHPTENTYLFYLADSNGVTYFSKTYAEHLAKRSKYINY